MADRYWVANGASANWNTAANWNTVADGSGSNGVPAATDNVFFGHTTTLGANLGNAACVMNTSPTIVQFTSYEGYNDIVFEGGMTFTNLINSITFGGRNPNELGFRVGMSIVVAGTTSNNGTHVINTISTTSIIVATALTAETATGTATYNADLDLSGNTLTFTGSGILMTLDSVIKNTSGSTANITINGGAYVGGSGNRYFLAGDNQNFENRDKIIMQFNTSLSPMYFDDGVYPLVQLASGVSATTSYVAPTSNVHGASKFYQISFDNTWLAPTGTVRGNLKKKFQVDNTDTVAIRSTLFDTGYSTWTFDTTTTMVIPTDGELTYGTGNIFNVRWYNLIIKNSGNANRLATIGYRRNLDVNSLTVEVGATLRGYATQSIDGAAGGTCTISSTTRPNIKGAWNFKQVADGVYSSILDEAYSITPSHGTAGQIQFSFGGGAFFSHSKMKILLDDYQNWEGTTEPVLSVCDGAYMKSSFFAFCQNFDPSTGSTVNSSIWESNTTPSVLYYTDSAGTHHNLLAGGGGGGSMSSFTVAGDGGASQTITDGNTLTIAGGTALTSTASATDTITLALDNTAVSAGTYGSATEVGQFTVDAQGRITGASNVAISGGGGGATAFTGLTDTPANYTSSAGKVVSVNSGATGLEFTTPVNTAFTVRDEGTPITGIGVAGGSINFVGAGVVATSPSAGDVVVSIAGGGGGGGYPLFKHDQLPTTHGFTPFRLLQNGDTIEIGVSSGGTDNKDVSVFTPRNDEEAGGTVIDIVALGDWNTNTGREYVFYGQDPRMGYTDYVGGFGNTSSGFPLPVFFCDSMRDIVAPPAPSMLFPKLRIGTTERDNRLNKVRVLDAGKHEVIVFDPNTGEPAEEPTTVRVLLVVDAELVVFRGTASSNYSLRM